MLAACLRRVGGRAGEQAEDRRERQASEQKGEGGNGDRG